jgi:hypothetical protein
VRQERERNREDDDGNREDDDGNREDDDGKGGGAQKEADAKPSPKTGSARTTGRDGKCVLELVKQSSVVEQAKGSPLVLTTQPEVDRSSVGWSVRNSKKRA